MSTRPGRSERVSEVVALLVDELLDRVDRHPAGHLARGRRQRVDVKLAVPLGGDADARTEVAEELSRALDAGIRALVASKTVTRPGHAFCLRCGASDCEHSLPVRSRDVFLSYGPTGQPRFGDFGQLLLERKDPRVDRVYGDRRELVSVVLSGRELTGELLKEFRDADTGFRLHGEVAVGFYRTPERVGPPAPLAITFQVTSTQVRGTRRRFTLNVVGVGPQGESLGALHTRTDPVPWSATARWAQTILEQIERSPKKRTRSGEPLEVRVEGLLKGIAKRLEQGERAKGRRTSHAEVRHEEGARPTRMAAADLAHAPDDAILIDTRHGTVVALGERGRAHVFNLEGKLVTSLRLRPQAIERRRKLGIWRDATGAEVQAFRASASRDPEDGPTAARRGGR